MIGVSLHTLLIHFPITLAIVACGYDVWALYARQPRLHSVGSGLIRLAALAAVAASATGLNLAGMSGLGSSSAVTGHAGMAVLATLVLAVTAILRYSRDVRAGDSGLAPPPAFVLAEGIGVVLVVGATIMGHRIS
jgi:uncharacterized membrane protein